MNTADHVRYRKARFSTRLPRGRRYTAAHYWLLEEDDGIWRVGFTQFATRMLGDLVEYDFSITPGTPISVGQEIGSIEGFKALTVLYSAAEGDFLGVSEELAADITAPESDPYGRGWLYRVRGRPDPESLDVNGYTAVLDRTIDRLLESRHAGGRSDSEADEDS